MPIDWDAEAKKAVAYVWDQLSEAHRGGFAWGSDVGIIFDNRSTDGVRSRQIEFVRKLCELEGLQVYATLADGHSWVMLLQHTEDVHEWAWASWQSACATVDGDFAPLKVEDHYNDGYLPMSEDSWRQYHLAKRTIEAQFANPNRWKNCQRELL